MNIILVCGGKSVEESISIITAIKVYKALASSEDYRPTLIYQDPYNQCFYGGYGVLNLENYPSKKYFKKVSFINKHNKHYLKIGFKKTPIDLLFPIVHGANTEDGTMASFFKTLGIPTLTSALSSLAIAQDKVLLKDLLKTYKIKTVPYKCISKKEFTLDMTLLPSKLKFPLIIKPATLGSSIGINIAKDNKELMIGLEDTLKYDEKAIIEEYIEDKKELNIALIKGKDKLYFSAIEQVEKDDNSIYTYDDKYLKKQSISSCPASIDRDLEQKIKDISQMIYTKLNIAGVVRFDFILSKDALYFSELNMIPGSYASNLFAKVNLSIKDLIDIFIEERQDTLINEKRPLEEPCSILKLNQTSKLKL